MIENIPEGGRRQWWKKKLRTFLQWNGKFKWNSITPLVRDSEFNFRFLYLITTNNILNTMNGRSKRERERVCSMLSARCMYQCTVEIFKINCRTCVFAYVIKIIIIVIVSNRVVRSSQMLIMLCIWYILTTISQMKALSSHPSDKLKLLYTFFR